MPSASPTITYSEHVAEILNRSCVRCHRPGGGAPFSLSGYENAKKWGSMITLATKSRYMPPWKAVAGYGDFLDENRLSDSEIDLLEKWAEGGLTRGDAAREPMAPVQATEWPLRDPDTILQMDKPFHVEADGPDVYRSFILKTNFKKPTWVKAVTVRPGNPKLVHHVIVFLDSTGVAGDLQANNTDGLPGIPDVGGAPGFIPSGVLGTWAPGSGTHETPRGSAMLLNPKDKIVIQVHYHKTGKAEDDQTRLGLYLAKEPIRKQVYIDWIMDSDLRIPAGEAGFVETYERKVEDDMTVFSAFPHMHNLGQSLKAEARLPDGSVKPLIWVDKWDFRWQLSYALKTPIRLPKDSVIHIEATYDNSPGNPLNPNSPPKKVKFGHRSSDEMLLLVLGYTLGG